MKHPGQGAGAEHDGTTEAATTATPYERTRAGRRRASKEAMTQRVEYVATLLVGGYAGEEIVRRVTAAWVREGKKRDEARAAEADPEKPLPRLLWGDDPRPPSPRTIEYYITQAKDRLRETGANVHRHGDRILGTVIARTNVAWRAACAKKDPAAMMRVVEHTARLFALEGAVRPQLTALMGQPQPGDEPEEPVAPPPETTMTEESAALEAARLLALGRARREERMAMALYGSNGTGTGNASTTH